MFLALTLLACSNSKVPEDAVFYNVQVTAEDIDEDGLADTCHPENKKGYTEQFSYAVVFEGGAATLYAGEDVFALGTIQGCTLTYSTVVIGEDTEADGPVKWQLFGQAEIETSESNACVEGTDSWAGTEWFEVISTENDTLEPGCQYEMRTTGTLASSPA